MSKDWTFSFIHVHIIDMPICHDKIFSHSRLKTLSHTFHLVRGFSHDTLISLSIIGMLTSVLLIQLPIMRLVIYFMVTSITFTCGTAVFTVLVMSTYSIIVNIHVLVYMYTVPFDSHWLFSD